MKQSDIKDFQWLHESSVRFENGKIILYAPPGSDFFCNNGAISEEGITPETLSNAPFFYTEVAGDFVMRVKVELDFEDTYDSSSIMILKDMNVWAKACFEQTDFGTHAVVSVVTNHISDDANGCNIDAQAVWLQVARAGQSFAFHYSTDGVHFYMMRFFNLPVEENIKVGFVPQSPTGKGGDRIYSDFILDYKTVKNIRLGA